MEGKGRDRGQARGREGEGKGGQGREGEGRGLLLRGGEDRKGEGKGREGSEGGRKGRISPYQSTFASGAHAYSDDYPVTDHGIYHSFELTRASQASYFAKKTSKRSPFSWTRRLNV